jgi:hypothetical protein
MGAVSLRRLLPVGGVLPLLLYLNPLAGQGFLLDARVEVSVPPPEEDVQVQITYRLLPEPGTEKIPLSALVMEPAAIFSLHVLLDGKGVAASGESLPFFRFQEIRDHFMEGAIQLPLPAAAEGDPLSLQITYRVSGAWPDGAKAVLPLVVPRWAPKEPGPTTFIATVEPPLGYTITESFPTSVLSRPLSDPNGQSPGPPDSYRIGLQGVPAMVILRLEEGEAPAVTLERALDLVVVAVLLAMGIMGLQYMRRLRV